MILLDIVVIIGRNMVTRLVSSWSAHHAAENNKYINIIAKSKSLKYNNLFIYVTEYIET